MSSSIAVSSKVGIDSVPKQKVPVPTGYHILVTMPKLEETTGGGVFLPDTHRDAESTASIIGFVISMGPDCYKDKKKFPTGPWCKEGDFVIFRSYSGTKIKISGEDFRLINDDTVEAVVDDPRGYMRG